MTESLVFISYSSKDRAAADVICSALEKDGLPCWIAPRNIPPGRDYDGEIIAAIRRCSVVLLVLTPASNASPEVKREVRSAAGRNRPILPVRLVDVPMSEGLEYYCGAHQWLDASEPPLESHLPAISAAVRKQIEAAAKERSMPPPIPAASRPSGALSSGRASMDPLFDREAAESRYAERFRKFLLNDGVIAPEEREALQDLAAFLGLTAEQVRQVEHRVSESPDVRSEVDRLLSPPGSTMHGRRTAGLLLTLIVAGCAGLAFWYFFVRAGSSPGMTDKRARQVASRPVQALDAGGSFSDVAQGGTAAGDDAPGPASWAPPPGGAAALRKRCIDERQPEACAALGNESMEVGEDETAKRWYDWGCALGNGESCRLLGILYAEEASQGRPNKLTTARAYMKNGCDLKDQEACERWEAIERELQQGPIEASPLPDAGGRGADGTVVAVQARAAMRGRSFESAFNRALDQAMAEIMPCFTRAQANDPSLAGSVTFTVSVNVAGNVTVQLLRDDPALRAARVTNCISTQLLRLRFGAARPSEPFSTILPFFAPPVSGKTRQCINRATPLEECFTCPGDPRCVPATSGSEADSGVATQRDGGPRGLYGDLNAVVGLSYRGADASAPTEPSALPATPDRDAVKAKFESVRRAVLACTGGQAGTAQAQTTIQGSTGRVTRVNVTGDFTGAAATCITNVIRGLTFPQFSNPTLTVNYSYWF